MSLWLTLRIAARALAKNKLRGGLDRAGDRDRRRRGHHAGLRSVNRRKPWC
ncbi:MAG: hypothetical protein QM811_11190 [Pirellulales bacterium]